MPHEQAEWDRLMACHHYLGFRGIVGEALRYVATLDGCWVALLGWGAAAFKCRHRDAFIGWKPSIQWQRLKLIANNVRFLVLPDVRIKNLASKALALNTKRLSDDWQAAFGHPLLLAETFVDDSRFKGTCYLAAGWRPLGKTRGFNRNGRKYYYHGAPKTIMVHPLERNALCLLADPLPHPELLAKEVAMNLGAVAIDTSGGLVEHLSRVPDPRMKRGVRHRMLSVLTVAVCAVLSGAKSYAAVGEWAQRSDQQMRKRMGCRFHKHKELFIAPSEPTLRRAIQQVDAAAVDNAINNWLLQQTISGDDALAIDGKTSRGSTNRQGNKTHLLSAFLHKQAVVVAQRAVDVKSNEITAVRPLLADLEIAGMVVTADALHTQVDTARFLVEEKGADYLFTVKDNQPTLKKDIDTLKMEAFPPSSRNGGQRPRPPGNPQDLGQ
ncbi:MAG TPA: ISAs1 family transposase [Geobacteraceae bacterium]